MQAQHHPHIDIAKRYFHLADAGDPAILDLLTDDITLYFPKFGTRVGKDAVLQFVGGLFSKVERLVHEPDNYRYLVAGDTIVVEGTESGVMRSGAVFPVPGVTDGRFCNVFTFRDGRICSLHIYVDPDVAGEDKQRFYWQA